MARLKKISHALKCLIWFKKVHENMKKNEDTAEILQMLPPRYL